MVIVCMNMEAENLFCAIEKLKECFAYSYKLSFAKRYSQFVFISFRLIPHTKIVSEGRFAC